MPNRYLNNVDDFNSVCQWLDDNLQTLPIIPTSENLQNVPTQKGIYFWFIHPNSYQIINQFTDIQRISPFYSKQKHELVYLGTAGTGKKGNSNLQERLEWHICQSHTSGSIIHGTLSTLRAGLGAMLANDLIIPDTETAVNQFIYKGFKVYWIDYEDDKKINDDEFILIDRLKPLFNIKCNSNARQQGNATFNYKVRRRQVYNDTKNRLGGNNNLLNLPPLVNLPPNPPPSIRDNNANNQKDDNYMEFTVNQTQSIHDVVQGIPNLPQGYCEIFLYNSVNPDQLVWPKAGQNQRRVTGRNPGGQNIYGYFNNIGNVENAPRWQIIQQEMIANQIEQITVQVCF